MSLRHSAISSINRRTPPAAGIPAWKNAIAKLSEMPERHPIAQDESEQLGIILRQMLYGLSRTVYRILFSVEADPGGVWRSEVRAATLEPVDLHAIPGGPGPFRIGATSDADRQG
jgi:hypothetical protein